MGQIEKTQILWYEKTPMEMFHMTTYPLALISCI